MKKILMMGLVAMAAMVSQASYLYWQIGQKDFADITFTGDSSVGVNYATVWAVDSNGQVTDIAWKSLNTSDTEEAMPIQSVDLSVLTGSESSYSFYIELANYTTSEWGDRKILAVSSPTRTYQWLADQGFIQTELVKVPQAWTGVPFNVPEPTSGMMLLMGLGLLALRRKIVA